MIPFRSHLELAHAYWESALPSGAIAIDATCGNGHDTLFIAETLRKKGPGTLYAFDIQAKAIAATRQLLPENLDWIHLIQASHASFPAEIGPESVHLIVYNLGYLPGGDKAVTTLVDSTLASIQEAMRLLHPEGLISITCYPGHSEGKREEEKILEMVGVLHPWKWVCCHHRWVNRKDAPSLLLLKRR